MTKFKDKETEGDFLRVEAYKEGVFFTVKDKYVRENGNGLASTIIRWHDVKKLIEHLKGCIK